MSEPQHSMTEMGRFWNHPEVAALRAAVRAANPRDKKAYTAALNAVRDKVSELKAADK